MVALTEELLIDAPIYFLMGLGLLWLALLVLSVLLTIDEKKKHHGD